MALRASINFFALFLCSRLWVSSVVGFPTQGANPSLRLDKRAIYLDCNGVINAAGLPAGFTPATFGNSMANFCGGSNAGCFCNEDNEVECSSPPGQMQLFASAASQDCFDQCQCADDMPDTPVQVDVPPSSLGGGSGIPGGSCQAKSCTHFSECTQTECRCAVDAYSAGDWFYRGLCTFSPLKRDLGEMVVCPCNGTYVSEACCEAEDGIVHEGPEKKLGELLPRD
ncbi:MAG: hypothetical protein M1817_006378 [Caeruleum heppii]|nr:MAG: hypothetical protein M1817_006378 [Caeruleum heppii]